MECSWEVFLSASQKSTVRKPKHACQLSKNNGSLQNSHPTSTLNRESHDKILGFASIETCLYFCLLVDIAIANFNIYQLFKDIDTSKYIEDTSKYIEYIAAEKHQRKIRYVLWWRATFALTCSGIGHK